MSKVRFYLSVLAFVFAVGGALATQLIVVPATGYEFIPEGDEPAKCEERMTCNTVGDWACQVNAASPILRDSPFTSTSCGNQLRRDTAPPAP